MVALTLSACGDQGPPPVGLIQLLEAILTAEVGSTVTVTVEVLDEGGMPIQGIPVTLTPGPGAGTVSPRESETNLNGLISAQWTVGTAAGAQTLRIASGAKSITVNTTALPGPPDAIVVVSGDGQTGQAGQSLAAPLVAAVQDRFGNGVSAQTVLFAAEQGLIGAPSTTTDADGRASSSWSLGGILGEQNATATASVGSVDFTADALPGPPALMTVLAGNGQTGVVGEALAVEIVLDVRDAFGNPAIGSGLTASGDGSAEPAGLGVDDEGRATFTWRLGTVAGEQTLTVSGGAASLDITATANPGPPAEVQVVSGDGQESYATAALAETIVARVVDAFGNGVGRAIVTFFATQGGGLASPSAVVSAADGSAQTTWTLGGLIGTHVLEARSGDATPAVFEAEAVSGPPTGVTILGGSGQSGVVASTLPEAVAIRVVDASGNPVPGVPVTFTPSGSGSASPAEGITPRDGEMSSTWTLGTVSGAQTLEIVADGLPAIDIPAQASPGPPASMTVHAGDGQVPIVSTAVSPAPSVRVADTFGNGVPGVAVTFAVESGGGSITGANQVTDDDGVATVGSWTVGPTEGLNTLTASAAGLATVTFVADAKLVKYDIEIRFMGTPPSPSQQALFQAAADRWEQLVTGELADLYVSLPAGSCGQPSLPAIEESVDDLLIYAEVVPIDGVGGTLGSAGPCWIRLANGLTVVGTMKFDEADFDDLEASGNLTYVILHEIGHIIGIGTLSEWFTIAQDEGGADPYFPGAEAVTRYDAAGGLAVNKVPVANTGGAGTRDRHWREAHMGRELMTGFLNYGVTNLLSAITVGALQDLGYTTNPGAADAYTVFPGALRAEEDRLIELIEIPTPPPTAVDENGRPVGVVRRR